MNPGFLPRMSSSAARMISRADCASRRSVPYHPASRTNTVARVTQRPQLLPYTCASLMPDSSTNRCKSSRISRKTVCLPTGAGRSMRLPEASSPDVYKRQGMPCLLTSLTTAAGFLGFCAADIQPFREMGVYASVGALMAYILSILVVLLRYSCRLHTSRCV